MIYGSVFLGSPGLCNYVRFSTDSDDIKCCDNDNLARECDPRIAFNFDALEDPQYYCTAEGETVNTCEFWSSLGLYDCGQLYCNAADVVSAENITIFKKRLEWLKEYLASLVQMKPVLDTIDYSQHINADKLMVTSAEDADLVIVLTMMPNLLAVSGN